MRPISLQKLLLSLSHGQQYKKSLGLTANVPVTATNTYLAYEQLPPIRIDEPSVFIPLYISCSEGRNLDGPWKLNSRKITWYAINLHNSNRILLFPLKQLLPWLNTYIALNDPKILSLNNDKNTTGFLLPLRDINVNLYKEVVV